MTVTSHGARAESKGHRYWRSSPQAVIEGAVEVRSTVERSVDAFCRRQICFSLLFKTNETAVR